MAKKRRVKVDNKTYNINSPEYRKLYSEGIMSVDAEGLPTYYSPEEATVSAKKINRGEEAVRKGRGKFASGILSAIDYGMQFADTPTALALELLTGRGDINAALPNITRSLKKFNLPIDKSLKAYETDKDQLSVSQALGIENPYLATPIDMLSSRGFRRKSGKAIKNPKQFVKEISTEGLPEQYASSNQAGFANLFGLGKPKQNFKSEIDWGKWNKEIPENKALMQEYNAIEQQAKANGTWMKNPDGSAFQGTPEQFIQQNSQNFKKAFPEGYDQTFRGSNLHIPTLIEHPDKDYKSIFTANEGLATSYSQVDKNNKGYFNPNIITNEELKKINPYANKSESGGVYNLAVPKTNDKLFLDAKKRLWADLQDDELFNKLESKGIKSSSDNENYMAWPRPTSNKSFSTDDLATYLDQSNDLKRVEIKDVDDGGLGDVLIHKHVPGNYAKSLIGNNGMFNMNDPNIYKGLIPGAVATGAALSQLPQEEKALGGKITNMKKKKFKLGGITDPPKKKYVSKTQGTRLDDGTYVTPIAEVKRPKMSNYEKRVKAAGKDSKRYKNLGSQIYEGLNQLPGLGGKDSLIENLLEYTPVVGQLLSIDDFNEGFNDLRKNNKEGTFNNIVSMLGVLPAGKYGNLYELPKYIEKVLDVLGTYGVANDIYKDENIPVVNKYINNFFEQKFQPTKQNSKDQFIPPQDNLKPNLSPIAEDIKALGGKITNMKKKKNNLPKYDNGTGAIGATAVKNISNSGGGGFGQQLLDKVGGEIFKNIPGASNIASDPLGSLVGLTTNSVIDMVKAIEEKERERRPMLKNINSVMAMGGKVDDMFNYLYEDILTNNLNSYASGGTIKIKPSKKGTFTKAAKSRGMGVQEFASKVLANKDNYSSAMVKKANFARNASKWKHAMGGLVGPEIFENGGLTGTYMDAFDAMAYGSIVEPENKFNTRLNKKQLQSYQQHSELFPSLLNDKEDYDTQGFYKNLYKTHGGNFDEITKALTPGSETEHIGTDKFKKPNHPTFSKESKYYIPLLRNAGTWEDSYFNAVNRNINNMNKSYGSPMEYMKYAEDYNQNSIPDIGLKHKGKVLIQPENQMAYGGMIDPSMYMQQMMYGTYAQGGQVPQNVPVEVEGEEMYEMPNGQVGEFSGPKHENGGIPIELPEGTKIYSDRLTINGKTMAERKDKREKNISKLERLLSKNPQDKFIKSALQREKETFQQEEQQDMMVQEQMNNAQQQTEQAMMQMMMPQTTMGYGGMLMANGGYIDPTDPPTNSPTTIKLDPNQAYRVPQLDTKGELTFRNVSYNEKGEPVITDKKIPRYAEYMSPSSHYANQYGEYINQGLYNLKDEERYQRIMQNLQTKYPNQPKDTLFKVADFYNNYGQFSNKKGEFVEGSPVESFGVLNTLYGIDAGKYYEQQVANMRKQVENSLFEKPLKWAPGSINPDNMMIKNETEELANGGMIKRADGSYSKRGLWDNIRANRGSGKKPTKQMLAQEKKIRAEEKAMGGYIYGNGTPPYGLPTSKGVDYNLLGELQNFITPDLLPEVMSEELYNEAKNTLPIKELMDNLTYSEALNSSLPVKELMDEMLYSEAINSSLPTVEKMSNELYNEATANKLPYLNQLAQNNPGQLIFENPNDPLLQSNSYNENFIGPDRDVYPNPNYNNFTFSDETYTGLPPMNLVGNSSATNVSTKKEESGKKTKKNKFMEALQKAFLEATGNKEGFTEGDLKGMQGTEMGKTLPSLMTLLNRLETPKNINFFREFGQDALRAAQEAQGLASTNKYQQLRDLKLQENAARQRGRGSARGVNTLRALDLASDMLGQQGMEQVYNNYAQQMMSLLGQKSQLENVQDQMVMQGEQNRDLADRQDIDAFYTNLAENMATASEFTQKQGRDLNVKQYNNDVLTLSSSLSKYGVVPVRKNGNFVFEYNGKQLPLNESMNLLEEIKKLEEKQKEKQKGKTKVAETNEDSEEPSN